jgi:large subunit ribosomal protein L10e
MGLRPAKCYRNVGHKQRAYTRIAIRVPRKNYIGAAPALKVRQFNMGNPVSRYQLVGDLVVKDNLDLRDNSLESARIAINRKLVKELGKDGFFMKLRVYPSHILRENKQAQGAGADRVSQGMTLSFGAVTGRSARVRKGQPIFSVLLKEENKDVVKEALMRAKAKFPCGVEVVFHKDIDSLGTLPRKKIEEVEIEVPEEKPAEGEEAPEGEAKEGEEKAEGEAPEKGEGKAEGKEEKKEAPEKK